MVSRLRQSAQIFASARSPLESLVRPLFTRLICSTTTSGFLVEPVTSSMWKFLVAESE